MGMYDYLELHGVDNREPITKPALHLHAIYAQCSNCKYGKLFHPSTGFRMCIAKVGDVCPADKHKEKYGFLEIPSQFGIIRSK